MQVFSRKVVVCVNGNIIALNFFYGNDAGTVWTHSMKLTSNLNVAFYLKIIPLHLYNKGGIVFSVCVFRLKVSGNLVAGFLAFKGLFKFGEYVVASLQECKGLRLGGIIDYLSIVTLKDIVYCHDAVFFNFHA